jgi:hypothetical protein
LRLTLQELLRRDQKYFIIYKKPILYDQVIINHSTGISNRQNNSTPQQSLKNKDFNNFETPRIKKEANATQSQPLNMKQSMENDIQTFLSQFDNAKDKKDRAEICIN